MGVAGWIIARPSRAFIGNDRITTRDISAQFVDIEPAYQEPMTTPKGNPSTKSTAVEARPWMLAALALTLSLACCAAYANSLAVPFIFDDPGSIAENKSIRSLANLKAVFSPPAGVTVAGRPLLNFSLALNYAWSGLDVWSWHVVNIAIHAAAGICLFGVTRQTLLSEVIPERLRRRATFVAFAIALLWTLHPLQTESVTYIVQRAESLVGLLLLLTIYCSIRAAQTPARMGWQVAAVVACALGMAAKEIMVVAPILVVLYDWAFLGGSLGELWRRRWRFYACLAATWVILAALVAKSYGRGGSAGFGLGITSWQYLCTQFVFIVHYLRLAIWPHPLILDYGDEIATDPRDIIPAGLLVLLLGAATLAAFARPRHRPLGFLGAWFFCILAPSSSILPVVSQTAAEHRMYLPLAALLALIVATAALLGARAGTSRHSTVPTIALAVLALVLGLTTANRNYDYRSGLSIWSDTAQKRPQNYRADMYVGNEYDSAGDVMRAIAAYDRSVEKYPNHARNRTNRAILYMKLGQLSQAESDLRRVLEIDPRSVDAHMHLAAVHLQRGALGPALAAFAEAIKLQPLSPHIRAQRGEALAHFQKYAAAIDDFSEALRLDSTLDRAYNSRGYCYLALGRFSEAIDDFSQAIALNPKEASYYQNRATAIEKAGKGSGM